MKRHRYQTKGAAKSLPSSSKGFYNRNLSALPYGNTAKAEDIKYLGRGQEVENLARQAVKKDKGLNVHTQEGRDDLTNPLAYAPGSGEALDLISVGHHLREGNYGDAAMYGAGLALPFLPGAAVKKVAGPIIDKVKKTVKPYVDNAQGAISFHGDQIASRINRNILDPIGKTVKPYASAFKEHSSGIRHGAKELMSPDSRPFTEIFPITKTQRELVEGKQNAAFQEGVDFVDNWVYETDRKGLPGYTGRTMRGPVARRIKNIGGRPTPISLRPDLPHSNPDSPYGTDDYNPFNTYTDRLVNSRRKFLKNSNLGVIDKEYIATNRNNVGGFNSTGTNESVTLRNRGLYYKTPQHIAEVGVHEKGHTFQNMIGKDAPYGWSEKISTYSGDHGGFYIPNLTTELGEQIGSEMVEPVLGKYNWAGSPDELHSELMSSRFNLAQEWKKNYGTSMQESIENLQNPRPEDLEWLLDDIDNKNQFWKEPSWWDYTNKSDILKKLPSVAAITGTGAALRSTRNNNEEMYKNGGAVKYQTLGTVESRPNYYDTSEQLNKEMPWKKLNAFDKTDFFSREEKIDMTNNPSTPRYISSGNPEIENKLSNVLDPGGVDSPGGGVNNYRFNAMQNLKYQSPEHTAALADRAGRTDAMNARAASTFEKTKRSLPTEKRAYQNLNQRDLDQAFPPGSMPKSPVVGVPRTSYQTKGTVTEEEYLAMSPQQRSVLNKNIIKSSSGAYDPDSDLLKSLREAEQMAQQNQADSSRVHNLYSELNEMVPETTYPRGTTTGSSFATLSPLSSYETYAPWELSELKEKRKNLKFKIGKDMNTMPSMHGEDFPAGAVGWSGHQPLRSRLSANNKVAFTDIPLTDHDIRDVRKGRMKNPNGLLRTAAEYARLSKNAIKDKLDGKYNYSDVYFDTYNANRYKPHGRVAPELLLPPTTVPFIDPYPTEKIKPRWANNLADYFRGGPDLKGAELATVDTELQPIQNNSRPRNTGYTSNTAGGYPMVQRGGGTGRVPLGAQFVPGKGYKYTND